MNYLHHFVELFELCTVIVTKLINMNMNFASVGSWGEVGVACGTCSTLH